MEKGGEPAGAPGRATAARRIPVQQRSRERFDRMLDAAKRSIAEAGSDAMKMSEVAAKAEVPIGSLYQFFPDKNSIIRTLAEQCHVETRHCIEEGLGDVTDVAGLRRAFAALFDAYYALFRAEPVMRDIWVAMQADKALAELELAETRRDAGILASVLRRLRPDADPAALDATALLVMHLGESAIRLAVSLEREEADRIVEAYKSMADARLASI